MRFSEKQKRAWELYQELGTDQRVADVLGCSQKNANVLRNKYQRYLAADEGVQNAMLHSGMKDIDSVHSGWIKTDGASVYFVNGSRKTDHTEKLIDLYKDAMKDAPRSLPTPLPEEYDEEFMTKYILADLHMGMKAWGEEAGENYDLDIAIERLRNAFGRLVAMSPGSDVCVIENLGDMFHANDQKNMTPMSGHILDVDNRFSKVTFHTVQAVVDLIEAAKAKHAEVKYVGVAGNHDPDANHFLTIALMMRYFEDPRVEIIWNPGKMWAYRFGKVMLAAHHGDRTKPERLVHQLADDYAEDWGQTKWRYLDTGHIHHDSSKDIGGVFWESHRTVAARDAYATGCGFVTRSTLKSVTYHETDGEVIRNTVGV